MGKPFNDVVKKGEMVEEGLKSSKIISYSSIKATTQAIQNGTGILLGKNKKDDVAMVVSGPWRGPRVHSRVFGPHMNRYVLGKKILRAGYFWFTMERDCIRFVRKYHHYQVHSDLIHSPSSELQTMYAPWHFVTWSMDVIGPIKSAASNRHRFILVAINYFTKWVEAVTFKSVTKKALEDFLHSNIICRFMIPKVIIIDNVANLNSHLMKEGQGILFVLQVSSMRKAMFKEF
ncbi:uncharacterized protein [Nicotiana tomentosiformis]|uniref:uncharacterized protein n=1 Tax=Nicotiana tomentosiformis TaxID=4098 RepID=UPI00388CB91D